MRDIWTPRQTRIVQRSSEEEVEVEATRSLHATAEAFLASAVAIVKQMRAAGQAGGDDPGQYLRAAAHFVLGTGYELTLKYMLRQSGLDLPAHHRLSKLYDIIPNAMRAPLDEAYENRMASVSAHEATIVLTMVTAGEPEAGPEPPRPDMKSIRGWFRFMDDEVHHHTQRFAWEDRREKRATQHFADLGPFCDILKVTLENIGVPAEPSTPHRVHMGLEDGITMTDSISLSVSPDSD